MHNHTQDIIKIDEFGKHYFWKCKCGNAIGCETLEEGELEKLIKMINEW